MVVELVLFPRRSPSSDSARAITGVLWDIRRQTVRKASVVNP